jgi:hypothetical protein
MHGEMHIIIYIIYKWQITYLVDGNRSLGHSSAQCLRHQLCWLGPVGGRQSTAPLRTAGNITVQIIKCVRECLAPCSAVGDV